MAAGTIMRDRLRRETAEIHERLHRHEGLGAAASGSIAANDYARLLARLFGFHRAYERALAEMARNGAEEFGVPSLARSDALILDLLGLGVDGSLIERLALCATISPPRNVAELLGYRYVVEGSALGGQLIARALEPNFGENRRFFLSQPGAAWRSLTERLETLTGDPLGMEAATSAARALFCDFENWMDGWRSLALYAAAAAESGSELAL